MHHSKCFRVMNTSCQWLIFLIWLLIWFRPRFFLNFMLYFSVILVACFHWFDKIKLPGSYHRKFRFDHRDYSKCHDIILLIAIKSEFSFQWCPIDSISIWSHLVTVIMGVNAVYWERIGFPSSIIVIIQCASQSPNGERVYRRISSRQWMSFVPIHSKCGLVDY